MGQFQPSLHLTAQPAFRRGSFVLNSGYAERFVAPMYQAEGEQREGCPTNSSIQLSLNANSIEMDSLFSTLDSIFTTMGAFVTPSAEQQDVTVEFDGDGGSTGTGTGGMGYVVA